MAGLVGGSKPENLDVSATGIILKILVQTNCQEGPGELPHNSTSTDPPRNLDFAQRYTPPSVPKDPAGRSIKTLLVLGALLLLATGARESHGHYHDHLHLCIYGPASNSI